MGGKPAIPVLIGPFPGPVHGVSVINAKLAEVIAADGLPVRRIDISPGGGPKGATYHVTRVIRVAWGIAWILVAPLLGRHRYVMHVDGGGGLIYNIALALAVRLTGQSVLLYHHSSRYVLADVMLVRMLLAVTGRQVPHVFCSKTMALLFCARYQTQGSAFIVNNAVWADSPAVGAGSQGGLRLGFLSALTLEKGLGRAIDTLRQTRKRDLDAELILAGSLVDTEARDLVRRAEAEFGPSLICRGVLGGADKAAFYGSLDAFLFPSLYPHETQSLVVPEALAAGTPVIAFDHRFVGEILGEGGLLIPITDIFADRAADWIAVEQSEEFRQARRSAARRQFELERTRAAGQVGHLIAWARDQ